MNHRELEAIADPTARFDRLVEVNVSEQIHNLAQTSIVQKAWEDEHRPTLHGWVYDLRTGLIKEVAMMTPDTKIEDIYHFEFHHHDH